MRMVWRNAENFVGGEFSDLYPYTRSRLSSCNKCELGLEYALFMAARSLIQKRIKSGLNQFQ